MALVRDWLDVIDVASPSSSVAVDCNDSVGLQALYLKLIWFIQGGEFPFLLVVPQQDSLSNSEIRQLNSGGAVGFVLSCIPLMLVFLAGLGNALLIQLLSGEI